MKINKNTIITVFKVTVKVIMVILTARDTWSITADPVVVALIDGTFFSFMLVLEFSGSSQSALALRPMAAVGAWVMYAGVILVGLLAHDTQAFSVLVVFLLARVAAGLVLVFDTYELIVTHVFVRRVKNTQDARAGVTDAVRRLRAREKSAHGAYMIGLMLLRVSILPLVGVCVSLWHVVRDVFTGKLLADDPPPPLRVSGGVRASGDPLAPGDARVRTRSLATADYENDGEGWYFKCHECGLYSHEIERARPRYGTMRGAQRGFAAHSQTHMPEKSIAEQALALVRAEEE